MLKLLRNPFIVNTVINCFTFIVIFFYLPLIAEVKVGVDCLFEEPYLSQIKGKKIGLITNHTAINSQGELTEHLLKNNAKKYEYQLRALFAPEHGLLGLQHNEEKVLDACDVTGIPIYSLHGNVRRPTKEMLNGIDLLIFDIQDIGSRSYTYCTTLFYAMEEAKKSSIPVIVLDRPNPLGGLIVDGPMLEKKFQSFVGYLNVPYCHGLTIGELALFFNEEEKVGCELTVVPMRGWKRTMVFRDTGLMWIPTSPQIPEPESTFFYPTTGLLGELQFINIGIGYTLPFKVIGAPWIDANQLAEQLNAQKFPGVHFQPFHYQPFFGRFSGKNCHGVLIMITDHSVYLPVSTQYLIIGVLKNLYGKEFDQALSNSVKRHEMFNKVNGTDEVLKIMQNEQYLIWKLKAIHEKKRQLYLKKRQKYLFKSYST